MTDAQWTQPAQIELVRAAPEHEPILANLLELYAHDFSEFHHLDIGEDGRYGYASLPLYWQNPDQYPILVKSNGRLLGLVLVQRNRGASDADSCWDMAEFFILRAYRRRSVGTQTAIEVWRQFPGRWQVRVMHSNAPAVKFWAHAIATFLGSPVDPVAFAKNGNAWWLYHFESATVTSR